MENENMSTRPSLAQKFAELNKIHDLSNLLLSYRCGYKSIEKALRMAREILEREVKKNTLSDKDASKEYDEFKQIIQSYPVPQSVLNLTN